MKPSRDLAQRQQLIPKIVKTLASLTCQEVHACGTTVQGQSLEDIDWLYGSPQWIEQKLWMSMTQAQPFRTHLPSTLAGQSKLSGSIRSRDKLSSHSGHGQACIAVPQGSTLLNTCRAAPFSSDVADTCPNNTSTTDLAAGDHPPTASSPFGKPHCSSTFKAGANTLDARLAGAARHAHAIMHTAPPNDQSEATHLQIEMLEDMIGQRKLTHELQSTSSSWHQQDPNLLESIIIYGGSQLPKHALNQYSAIERRNSDQYVSDFDQDIISTSPSKTFGGNRNTMNSQDSRQSLSELLGDDSRLANMWQRRRSVCPPGEDDAEQLHNMFLHDPDMKLFSPKHDCNSSLADAMMFDSYDFSRTSSRSSTSSSPTMGSRNSFEQLERISPYSSPSRSASTSKTTQTSSRDAKDYERQSSSLKQLSRPARMSEDDILFQQAASSRNIDIKKRKNPREYSRRH